MQNLQLILTISLLTGVLTILNGQGIFLTKEQKFWKYFSQEVKSFDDYRSSKWKEVNDKLSNYCEGLFFGQITTFQNGIILKAFYITAKGDKTKFDKLEKLVKAAPKFKEFEIKAYEEASYLKDELVLKEEAIQTYKIEYQLKRTEKNNFALTLFLPNRVNLDDKESQNALTELIYDSLGELKFSKISSLTVNFDSSKEEKTKSLKKIIYENFD
jgi:hypothetical protein